MRILILDEVGQELRKGWEGPGQLTVIIELASQKRQHLCLPITGKPLSWHPLDPLTCIKGFSWTDVNLPLVWQTLCSPLYFSFIQQLIGDHSLPRIECAIGGAKTNKTWSLTSRYTQFKGGEGIHHIKELFPQQESG